VICSGRFTTTPTIDRLLLNYDDNAVNVRNKRAQKALQIEITNSKVMIMTK